MAADQSKAFQLSSFIPYRANLLAARLSRVFAERYRSQFDLSMPEWRVIAHLSAEEQISVRDIGQKVELDRSTVTRAVQRLELKGLIEKTVDARDRRLMSISLTPAGWTLFEQMTPLATGLQDSLLSELGPEDSKALDRIFAKLHASLDQLDQDTST
ncbi:MarR family winged helix-turn-helix transcriptional regulator [Rhodovibrionaceae bacterium A322]